VQDIERAYAALEKRYGRNADVAVRSSATAEDLPGASFAGEHETYLGVRGAKAVVSASRDAMASLFTNRAISYRVDKKFDHFKVALSVGVQKMVRSDKGCSGVAFTLDTESGFRDVVLINGSWGLGEMVVQGKVTPDEYLVWKKGLKTGAAAPIIDRRLGVKHQKMVYGGAARTKVIATKRTEREMFVLSNREVLQLARWSVIIEDHYSKKSGHWTPMDIEWAKDGTTGQLFIVQARPETIHAQRDYSKIKEYKLLEHKNAVVTGASVGSSIAVGRARVILDTRRIHDFKRGEILVTSMTDPDWEPIMKIAAAIVTDKGGRTSHAAIVSRELGIPAVVGSENATKKLKTGQLITVDTTGSDGKIYLGKARFKVTSRDIKHIPRTKTAVMVNIAIPESAFETSFLPHRGVGLAREEFIIASKVGIHPLALLNFSKLAPKVKREIEDKTKGWKSKVGFYVDNLTYGIAKIGAAFYPMIGWRGASRYYDPKFKAAFELECAAIRKVREEIGLTNVIPMVPFCRTPEEGIKTLEIMAGAGLITKYMAAKKRGFKKRSLTPVYVMCEIPSNVILAEEFLKIFDGMSIGSNDLTQLTLGLDRDSGIVTKVADETDPAVKKLASEVIRLCKKRRKYISICGQAPSDHPDFAAFLVDEGIDSMSLNSDTVVATTIAIARQEAKRRKGKGERVRGKGKRRKKVI
jgi:pyruvate,water dikinase